MSNNKNKNKNKKLTKEQFFSELEKGSLTNFTINGIRFYAETDNSDLLDVLKKIKSLKPKEIEAIRVSEDGEWININPSELITSLSSKLTEIFSKGRVIRTENDICIDFRNIELDFFKTDKTSMVIVYEIKSGTKSYARLSLKGIKGFNHIFTKQ